jgi:hypothetical protein
MEMQKILKKESEQSFPVETSKIGGFTTNLTLGVSLGRLVLFVLLFTIFDSVFRYVSIGIASVESVVSSIVSGALLAIVLGFIFYRLSYGRLTRIGIAWFSLFIIQSLSNLVEAVFFTTAIPTATIFVAALVFGLITTLPEAILAGMLFSPVNIDRSFRADLRKYFGKRTVSSWIGRIALGSLVYIPIYYTFGSIIAPWILSFYDNPSQAFGLTIPPIGVIILLQFLRGFLYIVALIPIIASLKVSSRTMLLSLVGLIYVVGAFVPFIAYSELPSFLRVVHGLEILGDAIVYGTALVYILRIE